MKKIIALLLVSVMTLSFSACGAGTDSASNGENTSSQSDNAKTDTDNKKKPSGKLTIEDVTAAPVCAESDFTFCKDKDDNGGIVGYDGTEEIVVVPETIGGETIKYIEQYCFSNRTTDKAIRFPDTIEYFADLSCGLNENLEIVIMGKNTKSIGEGSFLHCKALREVVLNDGLEYIDTLVFGGCDSLKSIYIPESVTTIENGAFSSESGIVLHGKAGSYAEQYANENGYEFVAE